MFYCYWTLNLSNLVFRWICKFSKFGEIRMINQRLQKSQYFTYLWSKSQRFIRKARKHHTISLSFLDIFSLTLNNWPNIRDQIVPLPNINPLPLAIKSYLSYKSTIFLLSVNNNLINSIFNIGFCFSNI